MIDPKLEFSTSPNYSNGKRYRSQGFSQKAIPLRALGLFSLLLLLGGCGEDCRDLARRGDFELSQGNIPNALALYERALKKTPDCPGVKEKKERAQGMRRGQ